MISTNILSLFLIGHDQNGICNYNIRPIQDLVCLDDLSITKLKVVCAYFPNITLLAKRATLGEIQVTFVHVSVENNSLG